MEDQEKFELTKTEKRQPVNIDLSRGIVPSNYDELLQFAALYHKSGLAPKSFKDVPQVTIAMAMCIELERPIITGIQDMSVINGRVGIFGDAALAMVRASGQLENIKEWNKGQPLKDGWDFFCLLRRKGDGKCEDPEMYKQDKCRHCEITYNCEFVGVWTWAESIQAGFHEAEKHLPWRRFTKRMMQFKARNFIMRDKFGDILKGIKSIEEIQDIIELEQLPNGSHGTAVKKTLEALEKEHVEDPYKINDNQKVEDLKDKTMDLDDSNPIHIPDKIDNQKGGDSHEASRDKDQRSESGQDNGSPPPNGDYNDLQIIDQFHNLQKPGVWKWEKDNRKALPLMTVGVQKAWDKKFNDVIGMEYSEWLSTKDTTPPPDEQNTPQDQSEEQSEGIDPDKEAELFDVAIKQYQVDLNPPAFNRVLAQFDFKYINEIKENQREMILNAMSAKLDELNEK